eukprot:6649454-Prymnesium_polylepis.1
MLCSQGAVIDLGTSTDGGDTPLFIACVQGHMDVVQILSSYGANRSPPEQETAEEIAEASGHDGLLRWLALSR